MTDERLNVLEWYAANRAEVAVLRDPNALFGLGLLDQIGATPRQAFQNDLGWEDARLDATIEKLYGAGFVSTQGTTIAITPRGQQFLIEIGLRAPLPPSSLPEEKPKPEPPRDLPEGGARNSPGAAGGAKTPLWLYAMIGVLVLGAILIFGVLASFAGGARPTPTSTHSAFVSPTPTHAVIPTNTVRVIVSTPIASATRTPTRRVVRSTATPTPTRTSFSIPESSVIFFAKPTTINFGKCATLGWAVTNAQEIFLENRAVLPRDTQQVCPTETTTYTLTVLAWNGAKQLHTVQVTVTRVRNELFWTVFPKNVPTGDSRILWALVYAVDESAIVENVLDGFGEFRNTDPELDKLTYDPKKALQMLAEANYDGQGVYIAAHDDDLSRKAAEYIQKFLGAIDVPAKVTSGLDSQTTIYVGPAQ